jgi:predicted AlkP superfamily phosphohydrolase/phosphomutase
VLPICNPTHYSKELSQVLGRFYTQGFPEDTKALSHGIFSNEEYLTQSKIVLDESLHAFDYELSQFKEGFFFYYFSSIDQNTHMMWRTMDPTHPLYEPSASKEVKEAVKFFYASMDEVLRQTLSKLDSHSTLFLLSDHGFAPFGKEFNVSSWLLKQGFSAAVDDEEIYDSKFYSALDWGRTKAYALGLNGIYLNLKDREPHGVLTSGEAESVKAEIISKIQDARDPHTGAKILVNAYDARKVYSGPYLALAPDIVLGYASDYRISDKSVLGEFPREIISPREDKWAADHCMDPSVVPGVLFSNREIASSDPAIWDLAPSILSCFGLPPAKEMDGRTILG